MSHTESFYKSNCQLCVAQIIGTFRIADGGGGAQRLAYNLAVGLSRLGVRSIAVALRANDANHEAASKEIMFVPFGANVRNPPTLLKALFGLRALIKAEKIDLLHIHGAASLPFVVLATRFLKIKPKLVFTWQDSGSVLGQTGLHRRIMLWALANCDAVSGSSRAVAGALLEKTRRKQVGVFHGGVPLGPEPGFMTTTSPGIVWLGRIVPPKDPLILVHAASVLRNEGLKFKIYIVGEPHLSTTWYMDEIRTAIETLDLGEIVKLPGFMSDVDLQRLVNSSEISVQTSHTEGMSIALMEHMMSGLAIVATDVGDTFVAIENNVSGVLIPPNDKSNLIEALRRLLIDTSFRKKLAAAARLRAVNYFSIEAMAARAMDQYLSLVNKK